MTMKRLVRHLRSPDCGFTISTLRRGVRAILRLLSAVDWLISSNKTSLQLPEFDSSHSRIFVFVHHSESGFLDSYDQNVLVEAKKSGFTTILVTNCGTLDNSIADVTIKKARYGRDFAVMRDLSRSVEFIKNRELEFFYLNNSMVWKKSGVVEIVKFLRSLEKGTIWFPTDSNNPIYHVQPYFLYVNLEESDYLKFATSFEWIRNYHLRRSLIFFGEYQIFSKLKEKSWNIRVVAPYSEVLLAENSFRTFKGEAPLNPRFDLYNPTQHLWRSLSIFGIRGVKRSLILQNPVGVENSPVNFESALTQLS